MVANVGDHLILTRNGVVVTGEPQIEFEVLEVDVAGMDLTAEGDVVNPVLFVKLKVVA